MTQKQFDSKYPQGLNKVITLFSKSLHEIMTSEEIDRVIKGTKGRERRNLIKFKKMYTSLVKEWDVPIWLILHAIESTELFRNIISYMVADSGKYFDDENYHGESEDAEL